MALWGIIDSLPVSGVCIDVEAQLPVSSLGSCLGKLICFQVQLSEYKPDSHPTRSMCILSYLSEYEHAVVFRRGFGIERSWRILFSLWIRDFFEESRIQADTK